MGRHPAILQSHLITALTSLMLLVTAPASAQLLSHGTAGGDGFPQWYEDSSTLALQPCLTGALCPPLSGSNFDPTQPISFPNNYPSEVIYNSVNAVQATTATGFTVTYFAGLVATFLPPGKPVPGSQIVVSRIRIQITAPVDGQYVVTHPYGVDVVSVPPGTSTGSFLDEVGDQNFDTALGGRVSSFLQWTDDPNLMPGFVGKPAILHTFQGSPFGTNLIRVDGPPGADLDGAGNNFVQLDQASVAGQIFPLAVPQANPDFFQPTENTIAALNVAGNDKPIPPAVLADTLVTTPPAHGTAQGHPDGTVTYTPDLDFFGSDTFEYRAKDSAGAVSKAATATLQVAKAVVAPVLASISPNKGSTDGTLVTILGENFPTVSGAASVTFDTTPAIKVIATSTTELFALSPPHAAGVVSVTVTNAGLTSNAAFFTYVAPLPPPTVSCASRDTLWHPKDVIIPCTATNTADPADASFGLTTSVPPLTEISNASTNSRQICNASGCVTAGPIGGIMVDKKPPAVSIGSPIQTTYVLNQSVAAAYQCADFGSGVASCAGPAAVGAPIDTRTVGAKTFPVAASDAVGNASSASVNYSVIYAPKGICDLEPGHQILSPIKLDGTSVFNGSNVTIRFRVCDANGVSVGAAGVVAGFSLQSPIQQTLSAAGFRFDLAAQNWVLNLSTKALARNTKYTYRITLNDASAIDFSFSLK